MTGLRRAAIAVASTLLALGLTACNRSGPETAPPETAAPFTYVAVGASETVGVGADDPEAEAWTSVLHRRGLTRGATFVNVGVSGSTVQAALTAQVPGAVAEEPDLVTVWLNVNDLVRFVPVERYETDLGTLVRNLRRGGETEVAIANTPPIEDLPIVRACLPNPPAGSRCRLPLSLPGPDPVVALVTQYNQAIARVAEREGAVLVDLHAAGVAARTAGGLDELVSADGFHPSTEGHAAVAEAFRTALQADDRTSGFVSP